MGLAEKLIAEIDGGRFGWNGIVVLGGGEFAYGADARIVRLPFARLAFAALPFVVHEFGHFAGPEIRREIKDGSYRAFDHPLQELLRCKWDKEPRDWRAWHHTHEAFADVFATYTTGPAYPYACLALRFDPSRPHVESELHPSSAKRFRLMMRTLAAMDPPDPLKAQYTGVRKDLEKDWATARERAGASTTPHAAHETWADAAFAELFPILETHAAAVRYAGFRRARTLAPALLHDDPVDIDGPCIADLVNAAWLSRAGHAKADPDLAAQIDARAATVCARLGERPEAG